MTIIEVPISVEAGDFDERDDEGHEEEEPEYEVFTQEEEDTHEEDVLGFEDEEMIAHNVCPETDSEAEDEPEREERIPVKRQRAGEANLAVGQIFFCREDIKTAVLDHALKDCRNIRQERYDKDKLAYRCIGANCKWRLWAAVAAKGDKWEVRNLNAVHTCIPNGACHLLKVPVIARLYMDRIREEPNYFMPMKIQSLIKESWGISVSRAQCQKARFMALSWIHRYYDVQFERIRDYRAELLDSNPNSTVDVETWRNTEGKDVFDRFYCCLDVIKRSWKTYCRPLIGLDGCFLKAKMKGQLFVALGRDGNNQIYPIAWAVVQKEDGTNWMWFIRKLQADLDLNDGDGFVMISDRQKGLIHAVQVELPRAEHRMCVRHIYENLKKRHGSKPEMKKMIWSLAWSYNEPQFHENLTKLMCLDMAVYEDVLRTKPETWCRAFYLVGSCCEDVENNSTESFNGTIVKAREKEIIPMLELICRQAMVRIHVRSAASLEHLGGVTPYAQGELKKEQAIASECQVYGSTNSMFMVQWNGCGYRVSLSTRSCSCRKWDIKGIPCGHAYAVMMQKKIQVEDYVDFWFRTTTWRSTYEDGIIPARGAKFWPTGNGESVVRPPSPKQPGRKKKIIPKKQNRKKAKNESPTKKKSKLAKRTMHCAICGEAGHNIKGHKRVKGQSSQSEVEQSQSLLEPSQHLLEPSQPQNEPSQSQMEPSQSQMESQLSQE